ncbi:MAG: hypothetical protein WDA09_08975 [Bacteriovoracaceae bacterium]
MKKFVVSLVFIFIFTLIFWNLKNKERPKEDPVFPVKTVKTVGADLDEKTFSGQTPKEAKENADAYFEEHLKSLPTIDDLKNLTEEEVHHTPEIIKEGGELVGTIFDEAQKDPTKRMSAMNFFKKCAEDDQVAIPIRAVCLNRVYKLIPEWEIPVPMSDSKIPDEVLDLAMNLP